MDNIEIRNKIDEIDKQISLLLSARFKLAEQIGEQKNQMGLPIVCEKREQQVVENVLLYHEKNEHKRAATSIYKTIIAECTNLQK